MERIYLEVKEDEGRRYYYFPVGAEDFGRPRYRAWVHHSLVRRDEEGHPYIELPLKGARIDQGKSERTLILRPDTRLNVFNVFVPCGYRGGSEIKFISPVDRSFVYYRYRSQRGSLGVSTGYLVVTPEDHVVFEWKRTGRLYGADPTGVTKLTLNGREVDLEMSAEDTCELEELAEVVQ